MPVGVGVKVGVDVGVGVGVDVGGRVGTGVWVGVAVAAGTGVDVGFCGLGLGVDVGLRRVGSAAGTVLGSALAGMAKNAISETTKTISKNKGHALGRAANCTKRFSLIRIHNRVERHPIYSLYTN
jgi:hypothetical protein